MTERDKYTVTVGADYTTLNVEKAVSSASAEGSYPAETATLEVVGFNTSASNADGSSTTPYSVAFNTFTYTFETYMTSEAGNIVPVTGSVKGYFANSATASITTDTDGVATYTVTASSLDLVLGSTPSDFVLTIAGETVPEGKVFDVIAKDKTGGEMTYASFMKGTDTLDGYVDDYVESLFANASNVSALFTTIAGAGDDAEVVYDSTGAGSISITYTPSTAAKEIVTASPVKISLAKDATMTITVAGKGTASATSFVPATVTITNTKLSVKGLAADAGAKIETITIESLTVPVKGTYVGSSSGSALTVTNGTPEIGTIVFDDAAALKFNGTVTSEAKFGPAIEQNADKTVSLVTVDLSRSYTDKI